MTSRSRTPGDTSFLERLIARYGQTLETFGAPADNRVVLTLTPRHVVANGQPAA